MSETLSEPLKRWSPLPGPQYDGIQMRSIPELFYGGARGGGKSTFLIGDYCADGAIGAPWRGVLFRKTYPELEEIMRLAAEIIPGCWPGSEFYKQEKRWVLPTGATLMLRSLETPEDAAKVQGFSFSWIGWDELGQWPDDTAYKRIMACLRSAEPVEHKRIRATGNPGGPGQSWIKARFVDPAPMGYELISDPVTGMRRVFIPSRVTDNVVLLTRDPGYIDRLRGVGSPELVRAWLDGDFSAVVGSYFPEFSQDHIITPRAIPPGWLRFRAFDWGSARPSCCLWGAISDGETWAPKGCLIVYRELYLAAAPNVGLKLTAEQTAWAIKDCEMGDERVAYSVADPAIFAEDGGPSIAERFSAKGVHFRPADNRRIGKLGASSGWDLVRQRLVGEDQEGPMLGIFSTCRNLIRTFPTQQHDPKRPEDMSTDGEDHALDALRYACNSRPWVRASKLPAAQVSMNLLWETREAERQRW